MILKQNFWKLLIQCCFYEKKPSFLLKSGVWWTKVEVCGKGFPLCMSFNQLMSSKEKGAACVSGDQFG
jgi:hypothetical protein